jgi:hypothetical protein
MAKCSPLHLFYTNQTHIPRSHFNVPCMILKISQKLHMHIAVVLCTQAPYGPIYVYCIFPVGRQLAWPGIIVVQQWLGSVIQELVKCKNDLFSSMKEQHTVQQSLTWCLLKNTFGTLVYSKEYTFPVGSFGNRPKKFDYVSPVFTDNIQNFP